MKRKTKAGGSNFLTRKSTELAREILRRRPELSRIVFDAPYVMKNPIMSIAPMIGKMITPIPSYSPPIRPAYAPSRPIVPAKVSSDLVYSSSGPQGRTTIRRPQRTQPALVYSSSGPSGQPGRALTAEAERLAKRLLTPHDTNKEATATKNEVIAKVAEKPELAPELSKAIVSMSPTQQALATALAKRRIAIEGEVEESPAVTKRTGKLDPALRALIGSTVSGAPVQAPKQKDRAPVDPVETALAAVVEATKPPAPPRVLVPGAPPPPPPPPPPKAKAAKGKFTVVVPGTVAPTSSPTSAPRLPTVSAAQVSLLDEMVAKLKKQQDKIEGLVAPGIVEFSRPTVVEKPSVMSAAEEALQTRLRLLQEREAAEAADRAARGEVEVDEFGDALRSKGYVLQSVSFPASQWKTTASIRWLRSNGIAPMKKSHKVGRNYVYTIVSPKLFSKYYTSDLMSRGRKIELIYGK
jgi:hypothetical protein